MKMILQDPELVELQDPIFNKKEVSISVLRLDRIHPFISGNKWYKLKYNIETFYRQKKEYLVTFGGAYSNHIIAVAAAGKESGIKTIGIIRGDELNAGSNPALNFAAQAGMQLFFVSRDKYRKMLASGNMAFDTSNALSVTGFPISNFPFANCYFLPEGGSNALAVHGCAEITNSIPGDVDFICLACGTGATLAGISQAANESQKVIGVSVLRGEKFLEKAILNLNGGRKNFQLIHEYNFGGYAKSAAALDSFCQLFIQKHQFKIEPVYTGKLFFAVYDLIEKDFFKKGSKIVVVHTGGVFEW